MNLGPDRAQRRLQQARLAYSAGSVYERDDKRWFSRFDGPLKDSELPLSPDE